jgi:hypothetical protein
VLFVGDDWAEAYHDMEIQDETGPPMVHRRLPEGIAGIALLHELIGQHAADSEDADDPAQVVIGGHLVSREVVSARGQQLRGRTGCPLMMEIRLKAFIVMAIQLIAENWSSVNCSRARARSRSRVW